MKIMVIGSGGREHALLWKLRQSPKVSALHCAGSNAGIAELAACVDIRAEDFSNLIYHAKKHDIDLTVVGPEAPLCEGIVDAFEGAGLRIFGPHKRAARLEGSKVFAKELMRRRGIPTARFHVFRDFPDADEYLQDTHYPLVVKASGLAAGKGVTVCGSYDTARSFAWACMVDRAFGAAGLEIIVEERLVGQEASVLCFVDGHTIAVLASAQDHKAVFDGDRGPNTGGMGAYSPAPCVTEAIDHDITREVLVPTVHALGVECGGYRGILYAGLMLTGGGPKVLEFNCRFGDPETQPLMMRLKTDLVDLLEATLDGTLDQVELSWDPRCAVGVVLASKGYPGAYERGKVITGLDEAARLSDVAIFHAGTEKRGSQVLTSGGRVLCVTALGDTAAQARTRAYEAVALIHFEGKHARTDIAAKARIPC